MPRNSAGNYTLPLPPVATGGPIMAAFENGTDNDIAAEITNSLDRNGRGGMLAPFKIADGTANAPGMGFTQDPDNGFYRIGADNWAATVGGAMILQFAPGTVNVAGALVVNAAITAATLNVSGTVTVGTLTAGTLTAGDGTVGAPGMTFTQDLDNGFYRTGADDWSAAVAGAKVLGFTAAQVAVPAGVTLAANGTLNATTLNASGVVTLAGPTTVVTGSTGTVAAGVPATVPLRVEGKTAADSAIMSFLVPGVIGGNLGMDPAGTLQWGSAALGGGFKVWTAKDSFAWTIVDATNITCGSYNAKANEFRTQRSSAPTTGVVYLGNTTDNPQHYHFFDGTRHNIQGGHVNVSWWLAAGTNADGVAPLGAIDAKVGTNRHIVLGDYAGIYNTLFGLADNSSTFQDVFYQGLAGFHSLADAGLSLGKPGFRWSVVYAATGTINTSDARLKTDVQDSTLGLDFIETLRPVSYKWIVAGTKIVKQENGVEVVPAYYTIDGTLVPETTRPKYIDVPVEFPGVRPHWGLIAQEVKSALTSHAVADFGGYVLDDPTDPESVQSLRYEEFISPMIKAIQELSAKVKVLQGAPA